MNKLFLINFEDFGEDDPYGIIILCSNEERAIELANEFCKGNRRIKVKGEFTKNNIKNIPLDKEMFGFLY